MQKPYDDNEIQKCCVCTKNLGYMELRWLHNNDLFCESCYKMAEDVGKKLAEGFEKPKKEFNEPAHYHKHELDTITFLQKGFPPQVFMGFAIGHVIKYAQRSEYKGTPREDLVKMVDYAKRALEWYDKTHS